MGQLTPEELDALAADDRGPRCKQIVITFTVISFVSVCLRLFARFRYHKSGWEDWTIIVSMIASIGIAVSQVLQVHAGNGKHAMFVSYPEGVSNILKYLYFSIIAYNISLTITKISILLQYHRIFTLHEMRIPIYVGMAFVSAWGITTLFTSIFSCVPIDAYWKVTERANARCVNRIGLWYTNASVNIVSDLLVAIIPIRGIWSLQIPRRQKIALVGILTIGWFVCIVSILRVYALNVLDRNKDDSTYYSAPAAYWSSIEANLAIVCASLPALKPLIVRIVPVFGTRNTSRGRNSTAASANNHRLHQICCKQGIRKSVGDMEKLTSESSTSHTHSFASRPSENEQHGRNIYVTKHFEQHVEENKGPRDSDNQQEVSATDFLAHANKR